MAEDAFCAVMILAAGASRRMGQPKQLLDIDGAPLLRRVVQSAIDAKVGRVWVVLGANAEKIRSSLEGVPAAIVVNEAWPEGMGASIRAGMKAIEEAAPGLNGVMIVLGDQPDLLPSHLLQLVAAAASTGKSIVGSRSVDKLSPPVLFGPRHFSALRALQGDAGARALLKENPGQIAVVAADKLGDLDTPEDYAAFLKRSR